MNSYRILRRTVSYHEHLAAGTHESEEAIAGARGAPAETWEVVATVKAETKDAALESFIKKLHKGVAGGENVAKNERSGPYVVEEIRPR